MKDRLARKPPPRSQQHLHNLPPRVFGIRNGNGIRTGNVDSFTENTTVYENRPIRCRKSPDSLWYIVAALFLSTVINYIDRQTLSVLAPYIKTEFHWDNTTFALLIIAFRVAYAVGQSLSGRFLDRIGLRRGLPLAVAFYSLSAMATTFTSGLTSLAACRFLLGAGESANWPGAAKAVAEWFPRRETGWAVAIYDSGSAVGGAIAPMAVPLVLAATNNNWSINMGLFALSYFLGAICWLFINSDERLHE
jgi:ACS family hexuronate transporter-like MFS transporter